MVDIVYVERDILDHPISLEIQQRYRNAQIVTIEKYAEVFNPANQNFRVQKRNPAMILARKGAEKIMAAPEEYEIGGDQNYYFSHMLNCIYDCRYCFLQGMYRSANYLLFINYENFADDLRNHVKSNDAENPWYFSGYDCDSLALEPMTGFAKYFLAVFSEPEMAKATLELRTKSTQIRSLERHAEQHGVASNVVIAFSLNPDDVIQSVEALTPKLEKRLAAIGRLQSQGWRVGLRFDPVVWHDDFEASYRRFFTTVFKHVDAQQLDSITLGAVRLPKTFYKTMLKQMPNEWLFKAGVKAGKEGMVAYESSIETHILSFCTQEIKRFYSRTVHTYRT